MPTPKCSRCGKEVESCSTCKMDIGAFIIYCNDSHLDAPIRCKDGKFHYCKNCVLKQLNAEIEWKQSTREGEAK